MCGYTVCVCVCVCVCVGGVGGGGEQGKPRPAHEEPSGGYRDYPKGTGESLKDYEQG